MAAVNPMNQRPDRDRAIVAERQNLVLGLGLTGLSCVRYLLANGERVTVADSRESPPELKTLAALSSAVTAHCGAFSNQLLAGVERVILSPGIDRRTPIVVSALAQGIPVLGDVELFAADLRQHQPGARVIGVTGTNGKSTVTSLIAMMAQSAGIRVRAGANLGPPALELLAEPRPALYVLELSSYQLESTETLELDAAVLLNITPDHLDRYAGVQEYAAAKARIFRNAATAIVAADDELTGTLVPPAIPVVTFGLDDGADFRVEAVGDRRWLYAARRNVALIPADEVAIRGGHNLLNSLAALAAADVAGIDLQQGAQALRQFRGLPHRMQTVATIGGVHYINDSKGTNVGATVAALAGFAEGVVLIAGGDGKGQDFGLLAKACRGRVRLAVLIGRDRELLAQALRGACATEFAPDMNEAVQLAARHAMQGDVVLLSPACASLDMYRNYAARGEAFALAVQGLRP